MNRDFIENRWIPALESGRFPKGKGSLNRDGKFCCLGVACELLVEDGLLEKSNSPYDLISYQSPNTRSWDSVVLPTAVASFIGITPWGSLSKMTEDGNYITLTQVNDASDTFEPVIAEIRKALEEDLFISSELFPLTT